MGYDYDDAYDELYIENDLGNTCCINYDKYDDDNDDDDDSSSIAASVSHAHVILSHMAVHHLHYLYYHHCHPASAPVGGQGCLAPLNKICPP